MLQQLLTNSRKQLIYDLKMIYHQLLRLYSGEQQKLRMLIYTKSSTDMYSTYLNIQTPDIHVHITTY
jgi:hypothetical protein